MQRTFNSTAGRAAMDFALSEEQEAIFDMARAFGAEHIAPMPAPGSRGHDPARPLAEAGRAGLRRPLRQRGAGGAGLSRLDATLVFEALSMACPSVAAFLSIHNMCAAMIDRFADDG
jgi:alkylation response protein AidB-like acyl-CoA dehydrogenase